MSADLKPLGRKAYGSIGHIHGSRLGPGDHSVHEGQSAYCTTAAPKDKTVWVQTKLDGSCVSAALLPSGELVALGRAGYLATSSKYEMHHMWARWVKANEARFREVLRTGERIVGEWLAQAHGTCYKLDGRDPFVAFDIMVDDKRMCLTSMEDRLYGNEEDGFLQGFEMPDRLLGSGPCHPVTAMESLDSYGADEPEGVVYRVEGTKNGMPVVDFLAKWVRPDKVDGKYLNGDPVWNWNES
jgi:hypothetical protein